MAEYKLDCEYIEPQRLRPHCHKLAREIRPKDCTNCGWYNITPLGIGALSPEDVRQMGKDLSSLTDDDYRGEDGEAIKAWEKK